MFSTRQFLLSVLALFACVLASCQSDRALKYHNFPDAVTNINQVDPAYRQYFVDQQGRNYSADDQRKALAAAIRTSRTPVPAYVPRAAMASSNKARRGRSSARNVKKVASRKTTASRNRKVAAKGKTAKSKKGRSVAKRKTPARRRG